jgi:hypothetical protein
MIAPIKAGVKLLGVGAALCAEIRAAPANCRLTTPQFGISCSRSKNKVKQKNRMAALISITKSDLLRAIGSGMAAHDCADHG